MTFTFIFGLNDENVWKGSSGKFENIPKYTQKSMKGKIYQIK